ncbi:MAG: gliding motility-associated ABC transporter ATP-binding subunit GldA [Bacteroidales bacterium]|jgi:ABC-2 type transport system ATP-binding protein|nr:gliding motility-associated ABC transporter ATP-binding subunit GldA [Bacteroidales bacterium]
MSVIIKNITKLYGEQKALDNVSIEINKGEVVGLLGPNGAGKSTLMKIISCYLAPTEGTAEICGYDIFENPLNVKKSIGYLQESNPLYVDMYISEYLNFISNVFHIKNKKERIEEVIELTGLTLERKKVIRQLSKGYRQRVGLAQALIHNPEVLILDEPTTGLDPNQLTEIRELIKKLGEDKTVILSTHIMQEVEAICDRVIIINKGKIIANDSTGNVMAMQSKSIMEIEIKKPCPAKLFEGFGYGNKVEILEDNKDSIKILMRLDTDEDLREKIFNYAIKNNYTVLSMSRHSGKLEEIFIDLVRNN